MTAGPTAEAFLQLAQQIELLKQQVMLTARFSAIPALKLDQSGFNDRQIDLSDPLLVSNGLPVQLSGFEVSYLRRVSTPGGLLAITPGGLEKPFAPGDKLTGAFDSLIVKLAAGSAAAGTAVLRISQNPQAHFSEFPGDAINIAPAALLGTFTATGGVSYPALILKDLVPSGAQAGSFNISGWSTILVLIDTTSNGGTATTFDLVPWFQTAGDNANNVWYEQGTQRISVPDTNASGGQRRIVAINLTKAQGNLYLAINNLQAAARTGLLMCVLGVA